LPQAVVKVPLLEGRDQEVPQVVTIGEGKRLVLRAVPYLHLEERGVFTHQDEDALQTDRLGTLVGPGGEKLLSLLRHVLVGTVRGDARIGFDPQILAKPLVNGSDLLLRRRDRILTEHTCRIPDASACRLRPAEGDKHHRHSA
jgi:hypothetical protein